ncbi:hypothetical protein GF340_04985 [Candidatus Peregrinibacteria bacterium]|nr:hypothetical protein [Candidatus Peregrinibacteria bacterium]
MTKYDHSISVSSDQNGGNAVARISYFGIAGKERLDVDFGEFHGNTTDEAVQKANNAVSNWISENHKE